MSEELKPCPVCGDTSVRIFYNDDNVASVGCLNCQFETRDFRREESAIRVWNALPRNLRWTKETPTRGAEWYWYRDAERKPAIGYLLGSCLSFPGGEYMYIDNAPGEFAGPIQEPEEATT